jgi:hypothetical protein
MIRPQSIRLCAQSIACDHPRQSTQNGGIARLSHEQYQSRKVTLSLGAYAAESPIPCSLLTGRWVWLSRSE